MYGPTECAAPNVPCYGKRKMGPPRLQLIGIKEFQERRNEVLGNVIAGEGWETRSQLARRSVDGRNEDQYEQGVPKLVQEWIRP
jgi:hypothetical protein